MRIGYNTNGFAHHRLDDALAILAELGYSAVAITPDVHHLPPFETTPAGLRTVRRRLEELGLAAVIETGARFVLDPRRKHRPNLLEAEREGRHRRLAFLVRCAEIAGEIGAGVISIWSGAKPAEVGIDEAWLLLQDGVAALCERAADLGIRVGFEPEPGMFVETLAQWDRLRDAVRHPALSLTLDVGHVPCTESVTPAHAIVERADELCNVHLDDVRGGVHEHLQIGDGELDWPAIAAALRQSGDQGIAEFELSRHSHTAPTAAAEALQRFRRYLESSPG
ncbi:MAG TPA: sugar phosphate isomerase/epimerase family protein [Longimicrobiales bacterium]|nr:sugar phosphate isomerase/epimerase family protein [Longimicrobiales bacterium]